MARSRNIKPGFFKNENLGELPMGARLLFIGMWTLADREGRLEDRPARIAAEIFPYDREITAAMVSEWIDLLREFVLRYQVDGGKYIHIHNFHKHQSPHVKEQASTIPAPDLPYAGTGHAPGMPQPRQCAAPPDSLIPSSLIPDCLIPDNPTFGRSNFSTEYRTAENPEPSDRSTKTKAITNERINRMREILHSAMMHPLPDRPAIPRKPPDRAIVDRCLMAVNGADLQDVAMLLRSKIQGYEVPEGGPRKYGWFEAVLREAFAPKGEVA